MAALFAPNNSIRPRYKQKKKCSSEYPSYTAMIGEDQVFLNDQTAEESHSPLSDSGGTKYVGGETKTDIKLKYAVVRFDRQSLIYDEWSQLPPDPRGAELGREARVWKVYVGETEKWDNELLEGWEKSLDVLLGCTFIGHNSYSTSSVPHRFLIESSNMLKEDPNEISATALVAISQALTALTTNNSSTIPSGLPLPDQTNPPNFVPSNISIWINALWYSSFSLSIATAFMAMLAKDWCYSFKAKRTGHPYDQAHRRQRKWEMIRRWGMGELIEILPSLMHLSLLLFCVGMYLHLLDLNRIVAIPVMYIGGSFIAFYVLTSIIASFVDDFPYTTVVSRITKAVSRITTVVSRITTAISTTPAISGVLKSSRMRTIHNYVSKSGLLYAVIHMTTLIRSSMKWIITVFYCIFLSPGLLLWLGYLLLSTIIESCQRFVKRFSKEKDTSTTNKNAEENTRPFMEKLANIVIMPFKLIKELAEIKSWVAQRIKSHDLTEELVTILALRWLIKHCETPSAVNIALQAISGARKGMSNRELRSQSCEAHQKILTRIVSHGDWNKLYIRGLEFLERTSKADSANDEQHPDKGAKEKGLKEETPEQRSGANNERHERANQLQEHHEQKDNEIQEDWGKDESSEDIIHVMFWDLNASNERKVMDRLSDETFKPNKTNIRGLTLGNDVVSHSLNAIVPTPSNNLGPVIERVWRDINPRLTEINGLFVNHFQSKNQLLHPATVQSLANTMALYASLSVASKLPPEFIKNCIRFCQQLSSKKTLTHLESMELKSKHNIETGAVFVICILLLDQPNKNESVSVARLHNRAISTARILTKLYKGHSISSEDIFLVGFSEILSDSRTRNLGLAENDREYFKQWCSDQRTSFIDQYGPSSLDIWNLDQRSADEKRSKFLKAVSKVYGLDAVSGPGSLQFPHLPESTYIILMMIAICNRPSSQQSQYCHKLLSKFALLVPTTSLLKTFIRQDDGSTVLSTLWGVYHRKKRHSALHQLFAATQLWFLLSYSPSEDNLKQEYQKEIARVTNLSDQDCEHKKGEIKDYIVSRHKKMNRTLDSQEDNTIVPQSTGVWEKIRSRFQIQQRSDAVGHLIRQFGDGLNRFGGASNEKNYERIYLDRVVESINQKNGGHESQCGNQELEVGGDTRRSDQGTQAGPSASTPRVAPESTVTPGSTRHEAPGVSTRQWRLTFRAGEDTNPSVYNAIPSVPNRIHAHLFAGIWHMAERIPGLGKFAQPHTQPEPHDRMARNHFLQAVQTGNVGGERLPDVQLRQPREVHCRLARTGMVDQRSEVRRSQSQAVHV
ncbi:hypothetical protein RHS04_08205 [Rhizoctonia solani]|uniref:DUF6535 domain-containing protein n=1 Tax=Rhizoctonia solani TaxID=456999 RepID=A0A8H7H4G3_9AGAM|nr:hypothetical protein RHS04_08205 [Rhizoctonia solani]